DYPAGERPQDEPKMHQDMQQLPHIDPTRDGPDKAKELGLLMVNAGLPTYRVDPPYREPEPKKRHEQAEERGRREDATPASHEAHQQQKTNRDNGEGRTEQPDLERDHGQPAPQSEIPRAAPCGPTHIEEERAVHDTQEGDIGHEGVAEHEKDWVAQEHESAKARRERPYLHFAQR